MPRLNLAKRERLMVLIGIVTITLAVSSFGLKNARNAYNNAQNQLEVAKANLREAEQLSAAIEAKQKGHEAIRKKLQQRPSGFGLYSFTTRILTELNLEERSRLDTDRRSERSNLDVVLLRLDGVSMDELVNFLHKIYAADNLIVVQKLEHLKPASDGMGLDCVITFNMPKA